MHALDGFESVARVDKVVEGVPLGVETATGLRVCLVNVRGRIHAVHDGCTHQAFPLSAGDVLPDGTIQCPWHGARFDCRTGAVRNGPACEPVAVYEVRIDDGMVWVRAGGEGRGASGECAAVDESEQERT